MTLKVDAILCKTHLEFNLARSLGDYSQVISYHKISHRITKSDPMGLSPSDTLISINIRNDFNKAINKAGNDDISVLYRFKDLSIDVVKNFRKMVEEFDIDSYSLNLYILNNIELEDESVLEGFDLVKNVEL